MAFVAAYGELFRYTCAKVADVVETRTPDDKGMGQKSWMQNDDVSKPRKRLSYICAPLSLTFGMLSTVET